MASAYTDLKMGVTHTLEKIPGVGKGMVDTLRRTKSSIKQFVIPECFLRIWDLRIWDRWMVMIQEN